VHKCNKNITRLLILNGCFCYIYAVKWPLNINMWLTFLLHLCSKNDHSILTGDWRFCYIYAVKMTIKKVSHLLILNWSFLLHKLHQCNKNVSHLLILNWCKNDDSILTGDWRFCYIYAVKMTNSMLTGDWLFCYIFRVKWTNWILTGKKVSHLLIFNWFFLLHGLHKCNKNVSHLLLFSWSFLL
jgi:hypothetical protein